MTLKINANFSTIIHGCCYDLNFYNVLRYGFDYVGAKEYFPNISLGGWVIPSPKETYLLE
jgi:hypothetical protein